MFSAKCFKGSRYSSVTEALQMSIELIMCRLLQLTSTAVVWFPKPFATLGFWNFLDSYMNIWYSGLGPLSSLLVIKQSQGRYLLAYILDWKFFPQYFSDATCKIPVLVTVFTCKSLWFFSVFITCKPRLCNLLGHFSASVNSTSINVDINDIFFYFYELIFCLLHLYFHLNTNTICLFYVILLDFNSRELGTWLHKLDQASFSALNRNF